MGIEIYVADPAGLKDFPSAVSHGQGIRELTEDAAAEVVVSVHAADSGRSKHSTDPWSLFNNHCRHSHS